MVGISPAIRHATPDQSMGVPPPPRLWDHAYCRWPYRDRRGHHLPFLRRLRMGGLFPGCWGAESREWLLVRHYRSLRASPSLRPRAATSPRLILPTKHHPHLRQPFCERPGNNRYADPCPAEPQRPPPGQRHRSPLSRRSPHIRALRRAVRRAHQLGHGRRDPYQGSAGTGRASDDLLETLRGSGALNMGKTGWRTTG